MRDARFSPEFGVSVRNHCAYQDVAPVDLEAILRLLIDVGHVMAIEGVDPLADTAQQLS